MVDRATVRLTGRLRPDLPALVTELRRRLNQTEPAVEVTASGDAISFQACTWQPLLHARVEDARDEVMGPVWRSEFSLA